MSEQEEKPHRWIVTLSIESSERMVNEEVASKVEQAMLEQWGWVGFEGDQRVKVLSVAPT